MVMSMNVLSFIEKQGNLTPNQATAAWKTQAKATTVVQSSSTCSYEIGYLPELRSEFYLWPKRFLQLMS